MKRGDPLWRVIRASWPLLGGALGAWLGFGGYLALAHNADSLGSALALGFFAGFAGIGLVAGAATGAVIGGLADALLRRWGVGTVVALTLATLVNALAIGQIVRVVQTRYPGLRADGPAKPHPVAPARVRTPAVAASVSSTTGPSSPTSCSDPPPTQARERGLWDAECR